MQILTYCVTNTQFKTNFGAAIGHCCIFIHGQPLILNMCASLYICQQLNVVNMFFIIIIIIIIAAFAYFMIDR
jgi:hypothetical protein